MVGHSQASSCRWEAPAGAAATAEAALAARAANQPLEGDGGTAAANPGGSIVGPAVGAAPEVAGASCCAMSLLAAGGGGAGAGAGGDDIARGCRRGCPALAVGDSKARRKSSCT